MKNLLKNLIIILLIFTIIGIWFVIDSIEKLYKQIFHSVEENKINFNTNISSASAENGYIIHYLKPGQNLIELEKIYRIPWEKIKQINNIYNENQLHVGQEIFIPF